MNSHQAYKLMQLYAIQAQSSMNNSRVAELLDRVEVMAAKAEYDWPNDKSSRWVGFMQGVLWAQGVFSIDEMRAHVRTAKGYTEEECQEIREAVRKRTVLEDWGL